MDNKSESMLIEIERRIEAAEGLCSVQSPEELAGAISHAYVLARDLGALTKRRTEKNASAQKRVRMHTGWFKPMIDRIDKQKDRLRKLISEYLVPGGKLGNIPIDEIKAWGNDGIGAAALSRDDTCEVFDKEALYRQHGLDIMLPNITVIEKMIAREEMPDGVRINKGFRLRIS